MGGFRFLFLGSFRHRLRVVRVAAFGFAFFLTGALSSAAFAGDCIGCIVQEVSGNVGIGTLAPLNKLEITGASVATDNSGTGNAGIFSITTGTGISHDNKLEFGVHDSDYSWIQALQAGSAFRNLVLNAGGGNVGIGTATPSAVASPV